MIRYHELFLVVVAFCLPAFHREDDAPETTHITLAPPRPPQPGVSILFGTLLSLTVTILYNRQNCRWWGGVGPGGEEGGGLWLSNPLALIFRPPPS